MTIRLREVVALQHRRLLTAIDRAETALDDSSIRKMRKLILAHLDGEEALVYPLSETFIEGSRYGHEEHVLLRFALDRVAEAETRRDKATRIRVLRDLFVHHIEREEWVTLQLLEQRLDEATSTDLGRRLDAAFPSSKPASTRKRVLEAQPRRKER